jgi:hypothetical protein
MPVDDLPLRDDDKTRRFQSQPNALIHLDNLSPPAPTVSTKTLSAISDLVRQYNYIGGDWTHRIKKCQELSTREENDQEDLDACVGVR